MVMAPTKPDLVVEGQCPSWMKAHFTMFCKTFHLVHLLTTPMAVVGITFPQIFRWDVPLPIQVIQVFIITTTAWNPQDVQR